MPFSWVNHEIIVLLLEALQKVSQVKINDGKFQASIIVLVRLK